MKRSQATDDTPEDLRWQRLADAEAVGEASRAEAEFVRHHRGEGDPTRAEQELLATLRDRTRGPDLESPDLGRDSALIAAAVNTFLATPSSAPAPATAAPRWRPRVILGGLSAGLAAAASWLLIASPARDVPENISSRPATIAEAPTAATAEAPAEAPTAATAEATPELRLLRGPAVRSGRTLEEGEPLALGGPPLELRAGACLGVPGMLRACASSDPSSPSDPSGPSSAAEITLRGAALTLERGRLEVAVEAPAPEVGVVWIRVAGVALLGDSPGVLTITREENAWELRAEEGPLQLEVDGEPYSLAPGELLSAGSLGDAGSPGHEEVVTAEDPEALDETPGGSRANPERRSPTSDPRELLAQAQRLRSSGDLQGAARAYRRLIRDHGDTSLAVTAQASLGQLYLGPLKSPSRALRAFRAYLRAAPRGAMAEEALRGEIDALRRLGQDRAARRSSSHFLERFPRSSYAEGIRRDLEADGS